VVSIALDWKLLFDRCWDVDANFGNRGAGRVRLIRFGYCASVHFPSDLSVIHLPATRPSTALKIGTSLDQQAAASTVEAAASSRLRVDTKHVTFHEVQQAPGAKTLRIWVKPIDWWACLNDRFWHL
jgi:hypothetical protein